MVTLREKFLGCIAGSWVGSAMGAPVEGWSRQKVAEKYGFVDRLLAYKHYTAETDWLRPPGTTEDGIERQKLIATAIIEKGGRIKAHDLAAVWRRDLDPARMRFKQERFDRSLLELVVAGVPPSDLGRLCPFHSVVMVARASHPLGLINAGDPGAAADDTFEVGRMYISETAVGLRWAALYNASIAEACRPGATVESVIEAARRYADCRAAAGGPSAGYERVQAELDRALALAEEHDDPMAMRDAFYGLYEGGNHVTYAQSQASEIVAKGLAVFAASQGDPKRAILTAVNFGRDTDCLAAVAGGLAGTLGGAGAIPREWIDQVNAATAEDPYTNNRRGIEETADGLLEAFRARCRRMAEFLEATSEADK